MKSTQSARNTVSALKTCQIMNIIDYWRKKLLLSGLPLNTQNHSSQKPIRFSPKYGSSAGSTAAALLFLP